MHHNLDPLIFLAKRRFNRESLVKLTMQQKQLVSNAEPNSEPLDLESDTCAGCLRKFKNRKGLAIHVRSCKGERAEEVKIKGLEPMFHQWELRDGKKVSVKDKKMWCNKIRIWLLKRAKMELNLGLSIQNPQNISLDDDSHIHDVLVRAGKTVVACMCGDHGTCVLDSVGCGGDHAPPDYDIFPTKAPLEAVPPQTKSWLNSIVDSILGRDSLESLVVNGRKATTSLVESIHRRIRLPIPKGRMHRKNETALIKSGSKNRERFNSYS